MIDEQQLDPEMVDQIFDEMDDITNEMIQDWKANTNWADRDEIVIYLRLQRMAKRSSALDKLVPDRICPECKVRESRDSHWRIDKFHSSVICWTCLKANHNFRVTHSKFYKNDDEWKLISVIHQIFSKPQTRYTIDGKRFGLIRSILGITQVKLASILGITPMAICKIESGIIATMERNKIILCMKAFRNGFINRLTEFGYTEVELERFKWNEPNIEEIK